MAQAMILTVHHEAQHLRKPEKEAPARSEPRWVVTTEVAAAG